MHEHEPYNEPELLRQVGSGSEAAFRRLFDAYERRLYTYAYKVTGSREVTEDIVQEIFLRIWKMRANLPSIQNFNAYLHRIAHNLAYQNLGTVAREALVLRQLMREADHTEEAGKQLLSKEIGQHIQSLVDRLTPRQREVFMLSRGGGLKQEQIAAQLGLSITTVKSHIAEALKFLREELGKQYGPQALAIIVIWQLGNIS